MFLLDVNVLIALGDPFHVHHLLIIDWFSKHHSEGWATCPLTENGFLRIVGHAKYPKGPGSTMAARKLLSQLVGQPGHQFWPDSVSLCVAKSYQLLPASKNLTDYYLLALAIQRKGQLATVDRNIDPELLPNGPNAYHKIIFA